MLKIEKCELITTNMRRLAQGVVPSEGKAMVVIWENSEMALKPSTGAAGELFAGVSCGEPNAIDTLLHQESYTVGSDGKITLEDAPIANMLLVSGYTAGNGTTTGTYSVNGNVIQVPVADAGKQVDVRFSYAPNSYEAMAHYGTPWPGGSAERQQNRQGCIEDGLACTDQYVLTDDWSNPLVVRLGADGKFTTSGSGTIVQGARVVNIPNDDEPLLGIRFSV